MSAEPNPETATCLPVLAEEDLERQKISERERLFSAAAMIIDNEGVLDPSLLRLPPGKPIDVNSFAFKRAETAYLGGERAWTNYLVHDIVLMPVNAKEE